MQMPADEKILVSVTEMAAITCHWIWHHINKKNLKPWAKTCGYKISLFHPQSKKHLLLETIPYFYTISLHALFNSNHRLWYTEIDQLCVLKYASWVMQFVPKGEFSNYGKLYQTRLTEYGEIIDENNWPMPLSLVFLKNLHQKMILSFAQLSVVSATLASYEAFSEALAAYRVTDIDDPLDTTPSHD